MCAVARFQMANGSKERRCFHRSMTNSKYAVGLCVNVFRSREDIGKRDLGERELREIGGELGFVSPREFDSRLYCEKSLDLTTWRYFGSVIALSLVGSNLSHICQGMLRICAIGRALIFRRHACFF
jgi:hypothetical protein